MKAFIRSPLEVIQLVTEEHGLDDKVAVEIEERLARALQCAEGVFIKPCKGDKLDWIHITLQDTRE